MKDWKTTVSPILGSLPMLINQFYPLLPPKYAAFALAAGIILAGIFSTDSKTTEDLNKKVDRLKIKCQE